jgi:hypothetical protein
LLRQEATSLRLVSILPTEAWASSQPRSLRIKQASDVAGRELPITGMRAERHRQLNGLCMVFVIFNLGK